jgi:hypothetical protein
MERNSRRSQDLVGHHLPALLRRAGNEFAGVQGSPGLRDLQRGKLSYRMHRFTKDSSDIHPTVLTTHLTGWISHRPKGHWRGFAGLREALAWTRWRQSGG